VAVAARSRLPSDRNFARCPRQSAAGSRDRGCRSPRASGPALHLVGLQDEDLPHRRGPGRSRRARRRRLLRARSPAGPWRSPHRARFALGRFARCIERRFRRTSPLHGWTRRRARAAARPRGPARADVRWAPCRDRARDRTRLGTIGRDPPNATRMSDWIGGAWGARMRTVRRSSHSSSSSSTRIEGIQAEGGGVVSDRDRAERPIPDRRASTRSPRGGRSDDSACVPRTWLGFCENRLRGGRSCRCTRREAPS
jgi:hypothetical protein